MLFKCITILWLAIEVVCLCSGVKLPKFFNKCRKNDEKLENCIVKSGNEAMKYLADGNRQIRVPSLRPLKVNFMQIDVGGLKLNLSNSDIYGIENLHINDVKIDFTSQNFKFQITLPKFQQIGTYDVSGMILILPIFGHGPINATFINSEVTFSFDYDIIKIKDKGHMIPKNSKYVSVSERAYYQLENLFNGNELLSKEMNEFLDENWREVNQEIGPKLDNIIGKIITEIIKEFMLRVPFDDFYINE